ncbi:hypothetical protein GGR21_001296 [Dysgonomonas hofstadii]|uniref:Outer membrane protein beta-barrel domain-containing protein n=1 Tax=Dysgonomonas hofstadii TaxID=637886 RepID=A0A840CUJ6_9BACT|nr:outer membrane beta-barrel protein [Dysgonomonas hofstadii]MBB4035403.1 hypothetical protein [Dysgonomonas hofstadii]
MKKTILLIMPLFVFFFSGHLCAQEPGKLTSRKIGENIATENECYKNFRFTVGGGYAYGLGKLMKTGDKKLDKFSSDLRNGYNLDIEGQYFFKEHFGIALNGNFIKQSNTASGIIDIPYIGSISNYKESNRLIYVGASFVLRYENEKWGFYTSAGLGPIFYTNTAEINLTQLSVDKTAFGFYYSVTGEHRFNHNIGAGLKLAFTSGTIKMEGLDDRLSVSNLILTGFISFRTK